MQQQNSLLKLSVANKQQGIMFTGLTVESFLSVLVDSASGIQDKTCSFGPSQVLGGLLDTVTLLNADVWI